MITMSDLYGVIAGNEQIKKDQQKLKKLNAAQQQNLLGQKQYLTQLAQVNKALNRPADDMSDDSGSTSANANTTLEQKRSDILQNIESCKENTDNYMSAVQEAKTNATQTKILMKSMDGYATMSSRYQVMQ